MTSERCDMIDLLHTVYEPAGDGPHPTVVALHGWGANGMDLLGLAPYLAREMMSKLVHKLIADRMGLIQAQNIATREIALLEQRFAKIHSELQQRLQMYQERNAFLEEKLAERTAESQELIRTQIEALQKKLH